MKKYAFLLFVSAVFFTSKAHAQTTQEKCQQNACYGYGAPSGSCAGAFTYNDISQTPVQQYACQGQVWAKAGGNGGAVTPISTLIANLYPTGLANVSLFDATSYSGGTGTTIFDQSNNGNNCPVALGSNLTWGTIGLAYSLNFGSGVTTNQFVNCPTIASPRTVILIMSGTPISSATIGSAFAGYSQATNGFSFFTQTKVTAAATSNAFLLAESGTVTDAVLPVGFNMISYVMGTTTAGNGVYQNAQLMPYMDTAAGSVVNPSGGNLVIGGSVGSGFGAGAGARNIKLLGYIVYTTAVTAQVIQQDYTAVANYYGNLGINIATFAPFLTASQQFNVIDSGMSIDAGLSSQAPSTLMTLGTNYTVNNTAIPSSGTQGHMLAQANAERYYFNPKAGRNVYLMGGPTNDLCEASGFLSGGNTAPLVAWSNALAWINYIHSFDPQGLTIVKTMISRTGNAVSPNTGTCDAIKNTVNTIIRNNIGAVPNAALDDVAANPLLGADGANSGTPGTIGSCPGATTYFNADCTHPTLAGSTLYAAAQQAAIQANTGFSNSSPNTQAGTTYSMTPADRALLAPITAASTFTLPDCTALTGYPYQVTNSSAAQTLTIAPLGSETISGSTIVAAGASAIYTVQLTGASTGGCYWLRTQ